MLIYSVYSGTKAGRFTNNTANFKLVGDRLYVTFDKSCLTELEKRRTKSKLASTDDVDGENRAAGRKYALLFYMQQVQLAYVGQIDLIVCLLTALYRS